MKSRFIAFLTVLLLLVSICMPCHAAESTAYDFHALFQKVATMEDEQRDALSQELSSVFHEYPFQFIKALTQEDYALHDPVRKMIAEYNTSAEGNAEYIQFLLSLIPQLRDNLVGNENNTFLALLTAFDPNVNNAGEEFVAILFTALRYADGRAADQCSTILFRIFQQDPKSLVKELANEDRDFQNLAIAQLNYGSWGYEAEFLDNINALAADNTLTDAERNIIHALLEDGTPNEETTFPAAEPEIIPPTEYEPAAPTETEPNTTQPASETSGRTTAIMIVVAASILVIIFIAYLLKKRKQ